MKKLSSFLMIALVAVISLSFTSCDKDSEVAYTLDGTWKGNMYIQYGAYESTYSIIEFDQNDGLYSGTGYWTDFYGSSYWNGKAYRPTSSFRWTVRNGNIYITFNDGSSDVVIYDYRISDNYFTGVIEANNGNRASFSLTKYGSTYNWRDYYYSESPTEVGTVTSGTDSIQPKREVVIK